MPIIEFKSKEQALKILAEAKEIAEKPVVKFTTGDFPKQDAFVLDDSPRVAAKCTRRAGKSYGVGKKLFRAAYREPESTVLYLALTRQTAKRIMWKDVVKSLNREMKLNCKFNEAELTVTTPNGSVIYFAGADSGKDEMEKVLGGKLKLAVIDEAGSFRQDLRKLCYENIEPALADYDGTLAMVGTPTDLLNTLFHQITDPDQPDEPGWVVHSWDTTENPFMADNWSKRLAMLKETNPDVESTPFYRRMYRGDWVTDLSSLCYKFDEKKNRIAALPEGDYYYVLGVDLGFNDPSAFVVCAFNEYDKNLYIIDSYKASGMIISDVAERIKYYQKHYAFNTIVIDNAAKQSVEELKQRYGLPLSPAEKQGKAEFIEIMNSELLQGRIKLLPEANDLATEWKALIWDDQSSKREEHPSCENHLSDACLYAWRHCLQYLSEPVETQDLSDEDIVDEWFEKESQKIMSGNNKAFWEG